jgi:hypothetical protein
MATYSDSMIGYADFHSTGRYFALVMAASAIVGITAVSIGSGHVPGLTIHATDMAFVSMAGYVALALSVVMAIAVFGSLMISRRSQQSITVSADGVLSKVRGTEVFLSRSHIVGMALAPGSHIPRGMMLLAANPSGDLLVPRWVGGYGACIAELQSLGIPTLQPLRRSRALVAAMWASRGVTLCGTMLVLEGLRDPFLQARHLALFCGGLLVGAAGILAYAQFERRSLHRR